MKKQQIPSNATLVHSGPIFKIYQWEQEMFDGSYKTFEAGKRNDVVKIILIEHDHIIMTKEEQPGLSKLSFAGGFIEDGEDHFTAATREILEEIGYHIDDIELRFSSDYGNNVHGARHYYIARNPRYIQLPNPENGERIEAIRKNFDEFLDYVASDECFDELSSYVFKNYIITNKKEELKKFLLG